MKFLEMKNCPNCGTRVLPTSDGLCPNCHRSIADVRGVQVEIDEDNCAQDKEQGLEKDAKCPNCGLINPAGTINCDCGYNFDSGLGAVRNKRPFVKAFICSGVLFVVAAIILLVTGAQRVSASLGGVTACCLFSAFATGEWARRSNQIWSWARFAGTVAGFYLLFVFMARAGRAGAT